MAGFKICVVMALAACGLACAAPAAAADDLQLSKGDATELTKINIGKPYWSLQAECAGVFGAGYAYEKANDRQNRADNDESWGEAMLNASLARLQSDRGVDSQAAMAVAAPEVEVGRALAKQALDQSGTGTYGAWNLMRSQCEDIASAYDRLHARR